MNKILVEVSVGELLDKLTILEIKKNKIKDAVQGNVDPSTPIATLLGDVTSQAIMDAHLKSGEFAGKVRIQAV